MPKNSFRRASTVASKTPQGSSGLQLLADLPHIRRPYGSNEEADLVVGPVGRVYAPTGVLGQVPGDFTLPAIRVEEEQDSLDAEEEVDAEIEGTVDNEATLKAKRLWQRWSEEVIPGLLKPYLELLHKTGGLRVMDKVRNRAGCGGCTQGRLIDISCVFFDKLETIRLCNCTSIPCQLLSYGLFPCAPSTPTLAVDLNVLDFAQGLFVNAAPNTTAWCDTLEGFLSARKFKLRTRNSLRERFGNALRWYANLTNTKNLLMRDYMNRIRESVLEIGNTNSDMVEDIHENVDNVSMDVDSEDDKIPELDRPSDYLRERCPLCFGGENWAKPDEVADAIVCIDACFTQKRRKSQSNRWAPPHIHPQTVFMSEEEVMAMEELVETARPSKPSKKSKNVKPKSQDADAGPDYEPGMQVPSTVLDGCNESFTAADENRVKASTLFFADTGLMGLLCRHDRVLWLVNMTSPGEKQHYALALIDKLFQHIPESMRIGLLYDIGCQLHRSCAKHGFLEEYLGRIVFGISVFHAYGHQWPCQLIYHPRKCKGFGLTDGEGCERFWSSIKALIPSCRVSGFFTRLYTIDTKIKHLDEQSLFGLGKWIQRKWTTTMDKKAKLSEVLDDVYQRGYTEDDLRAEWDAQVEEQTKPLKKQSPQLANKEIEEILTLLQNVEIYKEEETLLENMMLTGLYTGDMSAQLAQERSMELATKIKKTKKIIEGKRARLSVDGRLNLSQLIDNKFLKLRMNALAIKQRIRDRLRQRKFEIENLERAYRTTVNQSKLEKHATQQIKKKEPGIQTLARNYNKMCDKLQLLITQKKAPRGALVPPKIQIEGLFKLDIDDDIWQDIGLVANIDDMEQIPDWLGNEDVRKGIKVLLELDRCHEEENRLSAEIVSMQQWFHEEWAVVIKGLEWSTEDQNIMYQLEERKAYLLRLCLSWSSALDKVQNEVMVAWGPTTEELLEAERIEKTANYQENEDLINDLLDYDDSDDFDIVDDEVLSWDEVEEDLDEAELIDNMEINLWETAEE